MTIQSRNPAYSSYVAPAQAGVWSFALLKRLWRRMPAFAGMTVIIGSFLLICAGPARAAQSYQVGNGTAAYINEWGVCRKVTNSAGLDLFVPTNTAGEWASFYNSPPGGVSVVDCPRWINQGPGTAVFPFCQSYAGFAPNSYCAGVAAEGTICSWTMDDGQRYRCQ